LPPEAFAAACHARGHKLELALITVSNHDEQEPDLLIEAVLVGGKVAGSRDTTSSGSPRNSRSTASIVLPADRLGRDR
jgi:hypothetical protein